MTGDGIMALFGAPIALEDAPQRAIRSAISIHREMVRFSEKIKLEKPTIHNLKMRIGIHSGPVVVGTLGNDLRVEFKAVGDTVNLASRMEGMAEPGTTYVTEETFYLTEGFFRFEGLGKKEIKGKHEPVNVYRVIAPSTRRTRFDVNAEQGLTPFVGRERELEILLDGFERVKEGRGQAFSIIAEAGLGKSRLLYEFRKAIVNEDAVFLEGKCLSYSKDASYHPIVDILKANFNIQDGDEDSEIKHKVKEGLRRVDVDESVTLPYLLELLSVKDSGIDEIFISPEAKRNRTLDSLRQIVLKGSDRRPLVIAVEDLHWIDKSSEESLKFLFEGIPGVRILLIFTYRPEFIHTWGGKTYHNQVTLNRLSNRESMAMVSHLLGSQDIERNFKTFILDKTEGVPFFIEEFIRSLKDLEGIERKEGMLSLVGDIQDVGIPSCIQDVIMARVDSLPEGSKDILQVGSVIGREFSHKLLKKVSEPSEQELLTNVSILKDSELLYERGIYPDSTYIFKHAITQETVYKSLLKSTSKKYHRIIAEALEKHFPENTDVHPEILGHHFTEGGLADNAILYWKKAGEIAARRFANVEAITHLNKGLDLLKIQPDNSERIKHELDMTVPLGQAFVLAKGQASQEVESAFSRALKLCKQMGESAHIFPALRGLCSFYQGRAQHRKAHELAKQLFEHVQPLHEPAFFPPAHIVLGQSYFYLGKLIKSKSHMEEALTQCTFRQFRDKSFPYGWDPEVASLSWDSWILWYLGYPDQALKKSHDACDLADELSHPHSRVFAFLLASRVHQYRREAEATQILSEKVVSLSIDYSFPIRIGAGTFMRGWALAEQR
ncbi:AAA family ATPase [Thermodesulfobacteriota bacterium]